MGKAYVLMEGFSTGRSKLQKALSLWLRDELVLNVNTTRRSKGAA
jgi:hypothetical protein